MPELPEVEALATFLRERAVGRTVKRADVAAISAVKTFDPPLTALNGAYVVDATRHGKFLDLVVASESAGEVLHLITHLSRAGWLHWRESLPPAPPRPGGRGRSRSGCISTRNCPTVRSPASTSPRPARRSGSPSTSSATRSTCPASPASDRTPSPSRATNWPS
jgi:hypothetical protein